jgi:signal transduction histidine kinase
MLKLLAIDDNQDNLTTLKAVVKCGLPDAEVLVASTGLRGIELACEEDPDVILLDIIMPGLDGFEVCRRLKDDAKTKLIPVVFLTALRTDRANRIRALEVGGEAFLGKPIDEHELVAQIRAMAKIKAASRMQRLETERLAELVVERTCELERELAERTVLQAKLAQAQRMEVVGQLAGGVAHDFNNLLTGISGYAELSRECLPGDHPVQCYLDEISAGAKRSADLTRQLLAFARKQIIAPVNINLNSIVPDMLKLLMKMIGENITLNWKPGLNLNAVKMDPSQVDQILANLCINARDAISGTGEVTIETANALLDDAFCRTRAGFIPGDYVMLAVRDAGCGMEKDVLDHLFEPFFTTKGIGKGTGLGLATVYGIVQQNNGFIDVQSEPGKGATFVLYLPRVLPDVMAPEVGVIPEAQLPQGQGETVLLVEDEKPLRELCDRFLKSLGYRVLVAETAEVAITLATAAQNDIHILLTDIIMPNMDGRQLAKRLGVINPKIKCLFMSGYTADVISHNGILDDGLPFIQKPFSRDSLALKLRVILDQ